MFTSKLSCHLQKALIFFSWKSQKWESIELTLDEFQKWTNHLEDCRLKSKSIEILVDWIQTTHYFRWDIKNLLQFRVDRVFRITCNPLLKACCSLRGCCCESTTVPRPLENLQHNLSTDSGSSGTETNGFISKQKDTHFRLDKMFRWHP